MFTCRELAGRLGIVAGFVSVALAVSVMASCNRPQTQSQPRETVLPRGGQPVLHAVYAQELRDTMRELNRQASQQVWMQLYTTGGPVVDTTQLADTADKMAQVAATRIPQAVANIEMAPTDRQLFLSLSQRLHDQAVILKQQAQRNELTATQSTMNQIISTCNTCHTMFRSVAGPLPS